LCFIGWIEERDFGWGQTANLWRDAKQEQRWW
jgi:hypothetical protein